MRYADDCSIYVKSEKAAKRVLESITGFIEGKLKLKVNRDKTKISQPSESTLLGFTFERMKDNWEIRIASKSISRIKEKMKGKTKRSDPSNAEVKIKKMEAVIRGWVNYFSIAKAKDVMQRLDEMVRVRLRIGLWKQWKNAKTRIKNLIKLGASKHNAYRWGHSSLGCNRIAHSPILCKTLKNSYFQKLGYVGFSNYYFWKTEHQMKLF